MRVLGEFFHAWASNRASRAKNIPHQHSPSLRWASFLAPSPLPHRAAQGGLSDASTSRGLKEKPPLHGDPAPLPRGPAPARERKAAPVRGSSTPVETFFAPAWGSSTTVEIFFAHAHPKWLIFDHFHLAGAIFLSCSPSGRHREPAGVEAAARHGAWPRCRRDRRSWLRCPWAR